MESPIAPSGSDLARVYVSAKYGLARHEQAEAVVAGDDGITVLCSADLAGGRSHTRVLRLGEDGSIRWERGYDRAQGVGHAIAPLPRGGFVIAGDVQRGDQEYEACLLRLDAEGGLLGSGCYGPPGVAGFNAVAVAYDGSIVAGGTAGRRGLLMRVPGTPQISWSRLTHDIDEVVALVALPDGGLAMAASRELSTTDLGTTSLAVLAANGQVRWSNELPTAGHGEPAALASLPDGSLVLVGHCTVDRRGAARLWVLKVHPDGQTAWERELGSPADNLRGRAVVVTGEGGVVVAGDAPQRDCRRVLAARLNADGSTVWERILGKADEHLLARGLARTRNNFVVLVGSTTRVGSGQTSRLIMCVDANGERQWSLPSSAG